MPLSDKRLSALAAIIAKHASLQDIGDIVSQGKVVEKFDELLRMSLNPPELKKLTITLWVVQAYNARDAIELLKGKLRRKLWRNDFFADAMSDFEDEDDSEDHHEKAIARRARTLRLPKLREFLADNESKICVIAGVADLGDRGVAFPRGTGFLAGESLVVTARHVLEYHIEDGVPKNPSPGPLYAFFDHLDGDRIKDPRDKEIAARRVAFHPDEWLQDFSDLVKWDGKSPGPLSDEEINLLAHNLDMVLIKLAEPIGLYSRWRSGGARRGWVTLPDETVPANLAVDDRILIPQHPQGEAQQIDFGRYKATDESKTRIRYNTETEKGTSGAPCFNQYFQLVGMHNSYFEPPGTDGENVLNQAIRFDHILRRIKPKVPSNLPLAHARLWSVSEDKTKPEVIIGRNKFLQWIDGAEATNLASRAQRIYVAKALQPKCGASFSEKILKAALRASRHESDPVIVMGTRRQALPATPADFVSVIAEELNIPVETLAKLPDRPDGSFQVRSPDGDKANIYPGRDLRRWLEDALLAHRTIEIDRNVVARKRIELAQAEGRKPDPDDVLQAKQEPPDIVQQQRWERIWIVVDGANEGAFAPDVSALLTALIGKSGEPEEALNAELRRIRWLFLGAMPDFVNATEACIETLDQDKLQDEDIADCVRAFAESFNSKPPPEVLQLVLGYLEIRRIGEASRATYENPATRLRYLQNEIADARNYFLKKLGAGTA